MATKNPPKISNKMMKALLSAVDLKTSIEMANIPEDCQDSAAASWAAANRPLNCWVRVDLVDDAAPAISYDLRFGKESKPRK